MEQIIRQLYEVLDTLSTSINNLSSFVQALPSFQRYDNIEQFIYTYSSTQSNTIIIPSKTFHSLSIGLQYIDIDIDTIPSYQMKIGKSNKIVTHQHGQKIELSTINVDELVITLLPNTKLVILKQY